MGCSMTISRRSFGVIRLLPIRGTTWCVSLDLRRRCEADSLSLSQDDDEFDGSYDALLRLSERLGDVKPKGGASQSKLSALPRFKYEDWPLPTKSTSVEPPVLGIATTSSVTMDEPTLARKGLEKEERCGVCLQDYEDDDECMLGLCQHGFHAECESVVFVAPTS